MLFSPRMKTYTFRAVIEKDDPGYHGYIPALPGCHTSGATVEETRKNLREALAGFLEVMIDHGDSIPKDESLEFFETIEVNPQVSRKVRALT